ncbi:MAG: hypothetical protein AB7F31_01150 [Parachlamydiales bacterium]
MSDNFWQISGVEGFKDFWMEKGHLVGYRNSANPEPASDFDEDEVSLHSTDAKTQTVWKLGPEWTGACQLGAGFGTALLSHLLLGRSITTLALVGVSIANCAPEKKGALDPIKEYNAYSYLRGIQVGAALSLWVFGMDKIESWALPLLSAQLPIFVSLSQGLKLYRGKDELGKTVDSKTCLKDLKKLWANNWLGLSPSITDGGTKTGKKGTSDFADSGARGVVRQDFDQPKQRGSWDEDPYQE